MRIDLKLNSALRFVRGRPMDDIETLTGDYVWATENFCGKDHFFELCETVGEYIEVAVQQHNTAIRLLTIFHSTILNR